MLELIKKEIDEEITSPVYCESILAGQLGTEQLGTEQFVAIGKYIFSNAQIFFDNLENRKKIVPICNSKKEILSYVRWNMQKIIDRVPQQESVQIERAKKIFVKECNETAFLWLQDFLQSHSGKEVILGIEWAALLYGQTTVEGENTISLCMSDNIVEDAMEISFSPMRQFEINTIRSIWRLKEKYVSYRIYLWLENEGDVDIFTHLSFSGIVINGFCVEQLEGRESFFNKQIVDVDSIIYEPDVIIVYGKENSRKAKLESYVGIKSLLVSYDELFAVHKEIYEKEAVIVYDSAKEAERVSKILQEIGIKIAGGCALTNRSINIFKEKNFEKEAILEDDYNIVLASKRTYCEETISNLKYIDRAIFVPSKDIFYSSIIITLWGKMALHLNNALQKGKRFFLYGTDSCYTNSWFVFFHTVGIKVEKVLDNYEDDGESVFNIYDVVYENLKDAFIVLNKKIGKWEESCNLLESLGFAFNKMYTGLYAVAYRHLPKLTDILLGHVTTELIKNTRYEGFRIYGKENDVSYKIVTLGGSTTTAEAYRVPCWPQILYEKLSQSGCEVIIYNGAVDGYSASDELYKLIRDVRCLKPDLIISFSGVNNRFRTLYPYISGYLLSVFDEIYADNFCKGLGEEVMSPAQIWVQQEQMMSVISQEVYHAKFICFAQPMYMSKSVLLPNEKLQFEKNSLFHKNDQEYRRQISELAQYFEWMIDLQDYFDNIPSVFFDEAHVYEKGNQMIAEKVYEYIIDGIPKQKLLEGELWNK